MPRRGYARHIVKIFLYRKGSLGCDKFNRFEIDTVKTIIGNFEMYRMFFILELAVQNLHNDFSWRVQRLKNVFAFLGCPGCGKLGNEGCENRIQYLVQCVSYLLLCFV